MKILVTGAGGFIGKNLIIALKNKGYTDIFEYDINTPNEQLDIFTKECGFVFHLAGVNRPADENEFDKGNRGFTCELLERLKSNHNTCPILISSSIQSEKNNPYGKSKKAAEEESLAYSKETGSEVYIYRLPNVFGKWCRPNYNSVIATFCYNISRGIDIKVNKSEEVINLAYIDDVVEEFIKVLENKPIIKENGFFHIPIVHKCKLKEIADTILSFKESRITLVIPSINDDFVRQLYSTYLSYLPDNDFSYDLDAKYDKRGCFCEFLKSDYFGQISISKTKPGITRGNHWHHTKSEKFLVVQGTGLVRLKKLDESKIIEYIVSDKRLNPIDIPVGYAHSIQNIGENEMILVIWSNQQFDKEKPDTYFFDVLQ